VRGASRKVTSVRRETRGVCPFSSQRRLTLPPLLPSGRQQGSRKREVQGIRFLSTGESIRHPQVTVDECSWFFRFLSTGRRASDGNPKRNPKEKGDSGSQQQSLVSGSVMWKKPPKDSDWDWPGQDLGSGGLCVRVASVVAWLCRSCVVWRIFLVGTRARVKFRELCFVFLHLGF
jgi:hypothetical protein